MAQSDDKIDDDTIAEFAAIFGSDVPWHYAIAARKDKNGQPKKDDKVKVESAYRHVAAAIEHDDWKEHLSGRGDPLSVLLNTSGPDGAFDHVRQFVCDFDDYSVAPDDIIAKAAELGLPCVATVSKSGGVHLRFFLQEAIPARRAMAIGEQVNQAIGIVSINHTETFPKQEAVWQTGDPNTDNLGNGISVPYFGATKVGRHNGEDLSLDEFISLCHDMTMTPDEVAALEQKLPPAVPRSKAKNNGTGPSYAETKATAGLNQADAPFFDGPPCLQQIAAEGGTDNHRDNFLYNAGVFLKFAGVTEFHDFYSSLLSINNSYCQPPLEGAAVKSKFKGAMKSDATYKCNEEPICSLCNKDICKLRTFGFALRGSRPPFNLKIISEPVLGPDGEQAANDLFRFELTFNDDDFPKPYKVYADGINDPILRLTNLKGVLQAKGLQTLNYIDKDTFATMWESAVLSADRVEVKPTRAPLVMFIEQLLGFYNRCEKPETSLTAGYLSCVDGSIDYSCFKSRQVSDGMTSRHVGVVAELLAKTLSMSSVTRWRGEDYARVLDQAESAGLIVRKRHNIKQVGQWVRAMYFDPDVLNQWIGTQDGSVDDVVDGEVHESNAEAIVRDIFEQVKPI